MSGVMTPVRHAEKKIEVEASSWRLLQRLLDAATFGALVQRGVAAGEIAPKRRAPLTFLHFGNAAHEKKLRQFRFAADIEARRRVEDMSIRPDRRGLGAQSIFEADPKEAVVGLPAVANHEIAQFARQIGVVRVEIQRFLEELADVGVRSGDGDGNDLGDFRSLRGGNMVVIYGLPHLFPSGE